MSASPADPVAVHILDREFLVACKPEERQALIDAARYLDGKMREVRDSARGAGADRVAILAALTLSHDLLRERQQHEEASRALNDELRRIDLKLERIIAG